MSALGSLVVSLSLEHAAFTQGLDKGSQEALRFAKNTQDAMDRMERSVQGFIGKVAGIGAAYLSLNSVYSSINKQVDALAQLDDAAQKTGASVELLSKLQKTAVAFGADFAGSVEPAITKLARGIAGLEDPSNKANAALKALGIQSRDSNGQLRDSAQITIDVAKALQGYRDDASKAALVTDLFGKSGAELLPFLNDAAENVDKFSGASAGAAANAAALQDSLNAQKQRFDEFVQQITIDILPAMTDLAGAFLDVQTKGKSLGSDNSLTKWADDAALALASLIDYGSKFKDFVSEMALSAKSIGASFNVIGAARDALNPLAYYSGNPMAKLKEYSQYLEKIETQEKSLYFNNNKKTYTAYEDAVRKRISDRPNNYGSPVKPAGDRPSNGYMSGQAAKDAADAKSAESAALAAQKAYDALTSSINKQIEAKRLELSTNQPLTESQKALLDIDEKRITGQLKMTDVQYEAVKASLAVSDSLQREIDLKAMRLKSEAEYFGQLENSTYALEDMAKAKAEELSQMTMSKAQIDALNISRYDEQIGILESKKALLSTLPDREYEIDLINRQIEALKTLRGTVGQAEAINKSKAETDAMFGSMENAARMVWTVFANSGQDAAKAAGAAIKASILDLLYQMTIKKFLIQVQASISPGGTINNLTGPITGNPNASIIDQIADGFKSINTTFTSSIEKLGAFLSNGQGGLADKIGGFLGQYSNQIASGISYLGAGYMLSQGNIAGAALTAAGTYFGGPIGGAIGAAIGGLFGSKKSTPRYSSGVATTYANGDFASQNLYSLAGFKKDAGGREGLSSAAKIFSETLNSLFDAFDINSSINTRLQFFKRKGAWGFASSTIDGISAGSVGGDSVYSKDAQTAFNNLIEAFLSTGIVNAIKVSKLPEGVKLLFDDLTDKTQISNMITASANLAAAQDALASTYNLNADLAGKVAIASGLAGDSLVAFVNSLTNASLSQQSAAATLIKERDALSEKIGIMPTTLSAFDAMLKTIDATTTDGQQKFADMFSARDRVSSWSSAIDAIKVASDNAKFSLLSQSEQMAISQQKLAEAFAEVNAVVPGSRDELVKWINGLDMTTEAGLKSVMAVPALVEAYQKIEDGFKNMVGDLSTNYFSTYADFASAKSAVSSGDSPAQFIKSQAQMNAQLVQQLNEMKQTNADLRAYLTVLSENAAKQQKTLEDWDVNGMPAVRVD